MQITAQMVKELREKTGAGMMDCKKALQETEGDIEKAISLLREKGMEKAAKKADRIAAEGLIGIYAEGNKVALVEINSETDFVAKNEQFRNLVSETAKLIAKENPTTNEEALAIVTETGETLEQKFIEATSTIGEKIDFRRFVVAEKTDDEVFGAYVHAGSRIGVVTVFEKGDEKLAKEVAMHIAAMKPQVLSYTELDPAFIEAETTALKAKIEIENEERVRLNNPEKPVLPVPSYGSELQLTEEVMAETKGKLEAELQAQGKPEKIWDKIIPGQLDRFIKDNTQIDQMYTLLAQGYVLDEKKTVKKYLESVDAKIKSFVRLEVGEGIEKREDNFAEEVMSQVRGN